MDFGTHNAPLARLLRVVSRRLWFAAAARLTLTALWIVAAVLVCGGLVHVFIHAHSGWMLGVTLAMPAGAGVATALWRQRPTPAHAATTADNWFHGKSLMTTALALGADATGAPREISRWIRNEANAHAARWLERVRSEHPLRVPAHAWKVLLPLLAGTMLYALPGARAPSVPRLAHEASPSPDTAHSESPAASLAVQIEQALQLSASGQRARERLDEPAQAPLTPDRPHDASAPPSSADRDPRAAAQHTVGDAAATGPARESFTVQAGADSATAADGSGDAAGAQPATERREGTRAAAPTGDDRARYENVAPRRADDSSARMNRDHAVALEGAPPRAAAASVAMDAAAAKLEKSTAYTPALPLAYREYVSHYLFGASNPP